MEWQGVRLCQRSSHLIAGVFSNAYHTAEAGFDLSPCSPGSGILKLRNKDVQVPREQGRDDCGKPSKSHWSRVFPAGIQRKFETQIWKINLSLKISYFHSILFCIVLNFRTLLMFSTPRIVKLINKIEWRGKKLNSNKKEWAWISDEHQTQQKEEKDSSPCWPTSCWTQLFDHIIALKM